VCVFLSRILWIAFDAELSKGRRVVQSLYKSISIPYLEDDEFIPGQLLLQSYKKITKKFQIGKKKKNGVRPSRLDGLTKGEEAVASQQQTSTKADLPPLPPPLL
jgi:hypothetical protein